MSPVQLGEGLPLECRENRNLHSKPHPPVTTGDGGIMKQSLLLQNRGNGVNVIVANRFTFMKGIAFNTEREEEHHAWLVCCISCSHVVRATLFGLGTSGNKAFES